MNLRLPTPGAKGLVGVVGFGLLTVGSVGIFVSDSSIGTATALAGGAVLVSLGAFVDRILLIKYKDYEIHLARDYLEAAELAEDEGAESTAEELRGLGMEILRRTESGDLSHAAAIQKLYRMARETVDGAVRRALEAEGLEVAPQEVESLLTYFSMVGRRGSQKVGVVISFGEWDIDSAARKINLSLHGMPGLKGVVVVQNMLTRRRVGGLPEPSISDAERVVENQFEGALKVRITNWRQGDSIDGIQAAIREVLS